MWQLEVLVGVITSNFLEVIRSVGRHGPFKTLIGPTQPLIPPPAIRKVSKQRPRSSRYQASSAMSPVDINSMMKPRSPLIIVITTMTLWMSRNAGATPGPK